MNWLYHLALTRSFLLFKMTKWERRNSRSFSLCVYVTKEVLGDVSSRWNGFLDARVSTTDEDFITRKIISFSWDRHQSRRASRSFSLGIFWFSGRVTHQSQDESFHLLALTRWSGYSDTNCVCFPITLADRRRRPAFTHKVQRSTKRKEFIIFFEMTFF